MKKIIRFKFNIEKFVNALAYFGEGTADLTKMKAAKLLYFLDKCHLRKYGRPVIGDEYISMDYGPVPSKSLDIINDEIYPERVTYERPNHDLFERHLELDRTQANPPIKSKGKVDWEVFSESEIEVLKDVKKKYAILDASKLVDLSHKDATWKKTKRNSEIDYRLFFDGLREDERAGMIESLELDQEDREIFEL